MVGRLREAAYSDGDEGLLEMDGEYADHDTGRRCIAWACCYFTSQSEREEVFRR